MRKHSRTVVVTRRAGYAVVLSSWIFAGSWGPWAYGQLPSPAPPEEFDRPPPTSPELPLTGPTVAPQGIVLGVRIIGNRTVAVSEIQRHIKTRKDREYDPALVQEDVRRLFGTRKFQDVRVQRDVGPGGVFLTFEVLERPTITEVKFIGNRRIWDKTLLKQSGLQIGEALNGYTVQEARRKVEEYYQSKGHPDTTVTVIEGDKPGDQRVMLLINEGHLQRIWNVEFVGNDPQLATDARLKTQIESKPGFLKYLFRGKVDRQKIDEDVDRLTAYYRGLGYFRARIGRELEFDDSGQWLTLKFVIDEGPRYRIRNLSIIGNKTLDAEQLKAELDLREGEFFNLSRMQRDENMLRDSYGSQGFVFADIKAAPRYLEEPGLLDLVYEVEEGDKFSVGKINIIVAGELPHTKQDVILNRLSLRPGQIIDIREVRASERRLKASQLFEVNPAEGEPPRIVIKPPDLDGTSTASRPKATVRSQSPDERQPAMGSAPRAIDIDLYLPPLKRDGTP